MAEYSIFDIIALFVSVLLPPLGVLMKRGLSHGDFWLNIILTFLGWLPGLFHAFYIVYKYRDETSVGGEGRPMLGEHPHTIKIHSTDSLPSNQSEPQYQQYQSEPQNQQYQPQDHQPQQQYQSQDHQPQQQYQSHNQPQNKHDKYNTPPSTPPPQMNYEDTHAGPSNEIPPAYGNHGNDKKLKGEADSYYNDRKVERK